MDHAAYTFINQGKIHKAEFTCTQNSQDSHAFIEKIVTEK